MDWLESELLVNRAVNHHDPTEMAGLRGRFDFVLDAGSYESTSRSRGDIVEGSLQFLKSYSRGVYVTLSPPMLNNIDELGVIPGSVKTALDATHDTIRGALNLNSARWGFFLPNKSALNYISCLFKDEVITPQVSEVFCFDHMKEAFTRLDSGQTKGKIVVDVTKRQDDKAPHQSSGTNSAEDASNQTASSTS